MKHYIKLAILATVLIQGFQSQAWISKDQTMKVYTFKFKMKADDFKYEQAAPSYEEAFGKAAQACYNHYKNGQRLSEDRGLDIIDVCANPRT